MSGRIQDQNERVKSCCLTVGGDYHQQMGAGGNEGSHTLLKTMPEVKNMNKCGGYSEKKTAGGVPAEFWQSHHFSDNISRPQVNRAAPARTANWPFSRLLTVVLTLIDLVRTERNESFIPAKLQNPTHLFFSFN